MNAMVSNVDRFSLDAGDVSPSLTSERDALMTRVLILEAALACIEREAEVPRTIPELSFFAVQRISSVARQALARVDEIEPPPRSGLRPIARVRS
jgi:hypothetical protein